MAGAVGSKTFRAAVPEDPGAGLAAETASSSSPSHTPEEAAPEALGEAEVEHVAEIGALEDIFLAESFPEALGAVLVILLPLFGIAQHRVGFADLLEFFFSKLLVPLGFVRVIFHGQLAVSLLDFFCRGFPANTQYLIIIDLSHEGFLTFHEGVAIL